jgi:hypothetical protein
MAADQLGKGGLITLSAVLFQEFVVLHLTGHPTLLWSPSDEADRIGVVTRIRVVIIDYSVTGDRKKHVA